MEAFKVITIAFCIIFSVEHAFMLHPRIELIKKRTTKDLNNRRREISLSTAGTMDKLVSNDYFYAILNVGLPTSQRIELALDTGSGLPYFSCKSTCIHCGKHDDLPYDINKSISFNWISCQHLLCGITSNNCKNNQCEWKQHYVDGSSISALVGSDLISFSNHPYLTHNDTNNIRLIFGCSETEANTIFIQGAEGVMGLSMSTTSFVQQIFNINNSHKILGNKQFAHCFAINNGGLLLFGSIEINQMINIFNINNIKWTPLITEYNHNNWYKVKTVGFKIEANPNNNMDTIYVSNKTDNIFIDYITSIQSGYHGTVFDTGSSTLSIPKNAANKIRNGILKLVNSNIMLNDHSFEWIVDDSRRYDYFLKWDGKVIFNMDEWNIFITDYIHHFPDIVMLFDDDGINNEALEFRIPSEQYLLFKTTHICLDLFDDTPSILVGSNVMMNKLIIYDIDNMKLGVADMDCDALMVDDEAIDSTPNQTEQIMMDYVYKYEYKHEQKHQMVEMPSVRMDEISPKKSSIKSYIMIYFILITFVLFIYCTSIIHKARSDGMRYRQIIEVKTNNDIVADNQIIITNVKSKKWKNDQQNEIKYDVNSMNDAL